MYIINNVRSAFVDCYAVTLASADPQDYRQRYSKGGNSAKSVAVCAAVFPAD